MQTVQSGNVRETHSLIASDKVEGTPVRRTSGDKIGTIERVMIDKRSGKVAYAVMSFGGFMGLGEEYYTLPWGVLTFSPELDAYELNLNEEQLRGAPRRPRGTGRILRPRSGKSTSTAITMPRLIGVKAIRASVTARREFERTKKSPGRGRAIFFVNA